MSPVYKPSRKGSDATCEGWRHDLGGSIVSAVRLLIERVGDGVVS